MVFFLTKLQNTLKVYTRLFFTIINIIVYSLYILKIGWGGCLGSSSQNTSLGARGPRIYSQIANVIVNENFLAGSVWSPVSRPQLQDPSNNLVAMFGIKNSPKITTVTLISHYKTTDNQCYEVVLCYKIIYTNILNRIKYLWKYILLILCNC